MSDHDDRLLVLWNDYGNHWSWEPIQDMSLDAYREALRDVNRKFVPHVTSNAVGSSP